MFIKLVSWWKLLFKPKKRNTLPKPNVPVDNQDTDNLPDADDIGKFHLGIIVGHTKKSPGAALAGYPGMFEYQYNTEIAKLIKRLAPAPMTVDIFYRDGVGISGAYALADKAGCDAVIELHFNAFNGQAFGTETLCTQDPNDVEFAHLVQKAMVAVFERSGRGNRGVKVISRSDRGGGNVHAFPRGANCLPEPFFGDNPSEVKMAIEKQNAYALCLIEAAMLYARKKDFIK